MRARRTMRTVRSGGLMPRNVTESSARLSWRGAVAGAGPVFWFSISLLLDDDRVVRGASPIASLAEETMQFDERVHRYPADADLHACARDRIEHPRHHNRDDAGLRFDLHEPPGDTLLAAAEANATPVEGMPAIMDHDFLPDMGRMTRRWPQPGKTACWRAPRCIT
jgi:hypothetical protein